MHVLGITLKKNNSAPNYCSEADKDRLLARIEVVRTQHDLEAIALELEASCASAV